MDSLHRWEDPDIGLKGREEKLRLNRGSQTNGLRLPVMTLRDLELPLEPALLPRSAH